MELKLKFIFLDIERQLTPSLHPDFSKLSKQVLVYPYLQFMDWCGCLNVNWLNNFIV